MVTLNLVTTEIVAAAKGLVEKTVAFGYQLLVRHLENQESWWPWPRRCTCRHAGADGR